MAYLPSSIRINHRDILIADILQKKAHPQSAFETATINFIEAWWQGQATFTLQTSGSTGVPKQILVTREQLEASARGTLSALYLRENDTALICVNTHYIAGIMMLVRCLIGNLKMEIIEPSADPFEKLSLKSTFDFCALVPYQVEAIINRYGLTGINCIKKLIVGGAPLSYSLRQKLAVASSAIYLTYGMTETLSHIALQRISGNHVSDFFTALPSIKLSQDQRKCLIIQAPYVSEKVITNDIVEILTENTFLWLGRWDNVINSGGVKLFPERIETSIASVFEKLMHKNDFFIQGIADEKLGTKAVLFIEGEIKGEKNLILQQLRSILPSTEIPKDIILVPQFLRTKTGKVKRQETLKHVGF
jgi:o-succinylbenzoate---CoA ligase